MRLFMGSLPLHQYKLVFVRLTSALSCSGCVDQFSNGYGPLPIEGDC